MKLLATARPKRCAALFPIEALTSEWYRPVPPPSAERAVVRSRQCQLSGDGSLVVLDYAARNSKAMLRNFYEKRLGLLSQRTRPGALRLHDPCRTGRSHSRGANGRPPAGAAHRSQSCAKSANFERRQLSGRHVRGSTRSALSQLCGRFAYAAALSPKMAESHTTMFPGNCLPTIICRRHPHRRYIHSQRRAELR